MTATIAVPMRVIVFDGHQDTADSAALLFKWWGHHAHSVYASQAAFERAFDIKPDLMLIDLVQREPESLELADRLRRQAGLEALQLVALSDQDDVAQWRRAKSAGFADYLVKPVPATEFLRVLLNARAAIARSIDRSVRSSEMAARAISRNGAARAGLQFTHDALQSTRDVLHRLNGDRNGSLGDY
ncbi:MAG TPA: response regulator [Pirellulales bacterium]|nr:response regulator [Pirellulales bacterium]